MGRRQVTIFLPADIAARVDEVRARFDPESARRIRPHVTVVHDGPDCPLDDLAPADLQRRVALVAREHPTFTLHLGAARTWGTAEAGIYLEVDDRDRALDALRRSLGVDGSGREFVPHVTLVHVRSVAAEAARDAWTALSGWELDADVGVESISVIESDDRDGWRTVATFGLRPDRAPAAVDRVAARVLVIDDDGAVLLLQGCDPARPDRGTWWFTPGGGLDEGESSATGAPAGAARGNGSRGRRSRGGRVPSRRRVSTSRVCTTARRRISSACAVPRFAIDDAGWSDVERRSVLGHRWWTPAELAATDETIFPETLADLVRDILGGR